MPRLNALFPVCFAIVVLLFVYPPSLTSLPIGFSFTTSTMSWSSQYEGWHSRALSNPHPNPNTFTPSRDKLHFAVLRNAPVEPEGISLAFFCPSTAGNAVPDNGLIAVDALGRVLVVSPADAQGILNVAKKTLDLPDTGTFRNTWVINQPTTSQPIDRIFVPKSGLDRSLLDDKLEISVQGFSKEKRELKRPVHDINELPDSLWELAGLVLEAREGATTPGNDRRNQDVLGKVKDVLSDLF